MKFYTRFFVFVVLFVLGLVLNEQYHKKDPIFTFRSEIWADRAGHYIYLPALFVYHMDGNAAPDSMSYNTGSGFLIREDGKILTKYPAGVAMFQAPFFGLATLIDKAQGIPNNGFTRRQHQCVLWSGLFWGLTGLFLLYDLLQYYTNKRFALLTAVAIGVGTNLLYYIMVEPGMSHVYSFVLFTWLLWLIVKWRQSGYQSLKYVVGLAVCTGLIVAVRQMNIVFAVLLLFLFEANSWEAIKERFFAFLKPSSVVLMIIIPGIIIAPQIAYYYYLSGKPIMYSYTNEGFDNWACPQIIPLLFAPNNGLLLYSPMLLISCVGIGSMFIKKASNRWVIAMVLLLVTYSYAAWHCWWLGCAFGGRGFVDVLSLFAIPFAWVLTETAEKKSTWIFLLCTITVFLIVSIRLTWKFNFCFFGEHDWDWAWYLRRIW